MKYALLPKAMWAVFAPSFKRELHLITDDAPQKIMTGAHKKYKEILSSIPEFDKDDRFIVNILSAAMLASVYLGLSKKPTLDAMTEYYERASDNFIMRRHLKNSNQFTEKYQQKLKMSAEKSRSRNNPYSWIFDYVPGKNIESFTANFYTCGICQLMNTLGIGEIIPAMCKYDYTMAKMSGTIFTREQTLASGGSCCDCHYKKGV